MAYQSDFTNRVLEKEKKKKQPYQSEFTKQVLKENTRPSALEISKQKYNTLDSALNSMSSFTTKEISNAIEEATKNKDYYKNRITQANEINGILYNKNSQNLAPNMPMYRQQELNTISNPRANYNTGLKGRETISETAKKSDIKYNASKEIFDKQIKNSEDYKQYEDYSYNALPLLKEVQNQRDVFSQESTAGDKIFAPILGGLSESLDKTFNQDGTKYRLANGNEVSLNTKTGLKAQKVMSEADNLWGKLYGSATYSLGNLLPSMVGSAINPIIGTTIMGTGTYNQAFNSSLQEGYTEDQANKYAMANTSLELGLGKLLGGMSQVVGKSGLSNVISKSLSKVMSNKATRDVLADMGSEFTEEYLQEVLDPFVRNLTLGEKNKVKLFSEENLIAGLSGALTSGISNLPNWIKNKNYVEPTNKDILNNINNQTQNNFAESLVNNAVSSKIGENNSKVNLPGLNNQVTQDINLPGISKYSQDNNSNVYIYETSDNTKINNLRQSASKYFNNTEQAHNFINTVEKVISDKNYNVIFDNSIVNQNGNTVNAQIKTLTNGETEVRLNPNSSRSGEFLLMHEVTHAIETDSMRQLVLDYASKHSDFNQALESLKQTYGTNDVSSEVVADISGQLFGNQEFINNLSMEKPNIFKRIYNSIISLANKITGNSHEALFIKDLKAKWENAYRTQNNDISKNAFSIQQDSHGNKYVNVDTDQNIFDNVKPKDYSKIAKQYILDNFKTDGIDYNKENINVTSRTAKEYAYPRTPLPYYIKDSKMKASTELDNLLKVSKYKYSKADDGRHIFARDGWDYYQTKFKVGDKVFEGLINIGKNGNKKMLYDITNLKEVSHIGTSGKTFSESVRTPLNNNTLPHNSDKVKLPTKYSMQENEVDTSYRMEHQPNKMGYGYDLTSESMVDESIYTNPEWYANMKEQTYKESFNALSKIRNNPEAEVTIYRATPSSDINVGDWITLSKSYAQDHLERSLDGKGNIVEKKVKAKDIQWAGDDINEFGYFPDGDLKNSISDNSKWQSYLEKNYNSAGTTTNMQDIKQSTIKDTNITDKINLPMSEDVKQQTNNKLLNPIEISNLTKEDVSTTPVLPRVNRNKTGDGDSHFYTNIQTKTNMLSDQQKNHILSSDEVKFYDKITNKESLNKAFDRLNKNGQAETLAWFNKDIKQADATDIAEGWILMKQYADSGEYDSMVETAKKMRSIGSNAGQTVQAFNIMERMTPEGMVKYAQSELTEAYDKMIKNKSKEWIDKHRSDFDLKPDEVQFIMDNMKEVSKMEDGYDKRVKLAEIQKLMTDKLPPERGSAIKSWMRISMLFNPKTQVRNVAGNAIIAPINYFGDVFSSYADKVISKKTGKRTTGNINIKAIIKGLKAGAYQATNDYKKGINTKDMDGNRFEIGESKSFNDKKLIGKSLNRVEGLLNYVMDVGDRVFSQSSFENSLQNQLVLNNTTEVTKDMIDIATTESLQRTWNDNNNYTKFVLDIRRMLNRIGTEKYGLGDILIPFAKTPANITKAIVDYSPAGLVTTILEGNKLRKSLTNGQYTPQMQHKFVQTLGKATAGTLLYIAGYGLAKAGITSGESDDDKDTANFLKNTLGISSYSIKIGNKSFTYDWAQPIAAPLSIMSNIINSENKEKALLEAITGNLDTAGSILLEQSFLTSLNEVLNDNDGVVSGLINQMLNLPARAVPTFSKQIADLVDGTQRTSFEYGKPVKSAINSIKAKIPGLSKTLAPTVDTLGREVEKHGGKNGIFNVFLNPANVNTENISEGAKEIYRLYKETGNKNIMPKVAPYYLNKKGEKITFTSHERAEYQKVSGKIVEESVLKLLETKEYKNMSDTEKANVINNIVDYSYNIAQKEVLSTEISKSYEKAYEYSKVGNVSDYYSLKNSIDENNKKQSIGNYLINSNLSDKELATLYAYYYSSEEKLNNLITMKIPIKEFIKLNSEDIQGDYYISNGKSVSGSKKNKIIKYVESLKLSIPQKAILIKSQYKTFNSYNDEIFNYINNLKVSKDEKKVLLKSVGFDSYNKDIITYINSQSISKEEKEKKLKALGFTVRNGKVYN